MGEIHVQNFLTAHRNVLEVILSLLRYLHFKVPRLDQGLELLRSLVEESAVQLERGRQLVELVFRFGVREVHVIEEIFGWQSL